MRRLPLLLLVLLLALNVHGQYWRDTASYRLNKVQPHSNIVPQGDWVRSLNGTWATQGGDSVALPSALPLRDSVTQYQKHFTLPPHWQGRRTIIHFAAAGPAIYLYINGRLVGYSEDSKTPAEWDITRYLNQGRNEVKAVVHRQCTGSHLEASRPAAGIVRDVLLYSVPRTYISDIKVAAGLDTTNFRTGHLDVMVDLSREVQGGQVKIELSDSRGVIAEQRKRLAAGDWFISLAPEVGQVMPWSDSTPALYTLVVSLYDVSGQETERIVKSIGFRHVSVKKSLLCVNGKAVDIRGINRIEQSPLGGQYVSRGEMRQMALGLKRMGFNAVRTMYHPADEYWYDLCDSVGLYVWDEANVSPTEASVIDDKVWLNPILDRIYNMFRRDRNHPSVIVWVLGEGQSNGYCMEEAYRFLKGKDNTRLVAFEAAWTGRNTDIVSPRIPSPSFLARCASNLSGDRPCIPLGISSTAGSLHDFRKAVVGHPRLQGAFLNGFDALEILEVFGGNH